MRDTRVPALPVLGVNLFTDPKYLKEGECVWMRDLFPKSPGSVRTRPTMTYVQDVVTVGLSNTDVPCPGGIVFDSDDSSTLGLFPHLKAGMMTIANVNKSGGVVEDKAVSAVATYDANPIMAQMGKKIYILPGKSARLFRGRGGFTNAMFIYDVVAQTFASYDWAAPNASLKPLGLCNYKGRMVYWNLAPNFEDCVCFSDRDAATTMDNGGSLAGVLATDGSYIRIGSAGEGAIMACVPVQLGSVADPANSGLLVLKERAAYLVTGEPKESTETIDPINTLEVNHLNVRASCVSYNTVVKTEDAVVWLGVDDVWAFRSGGIPVRVGTKLQSQITAQQSLSQNNWKLYAAYFDGFYRLALFPAGSTSSFPENVWWLDLRQGLPDDPNTALWYGPMVYRPCTGAGVDPNGALADSVGKGVADMVVDKRSGYAPRLLVPHIYANEAGAILMTLSEINSTYGTEDIAAASASLTVSRRIFNKLKPELKTPKFVNGDLTTDKIFAGVELGLQASSVVKSAVDVYANEVLTQQLGRNFQNATSYDEQLVSPDSATRVTGKNIWLGINFAGGILIDSSNDVISLTYDATTERRTTLAHGYYASSKALLNAIVSALNSWYVANGYAGTWTGTLAAVGLTYKAQLVVTGGAAFECLSGLTPAAGTALWNLLGFTVSPGAFATTNTADVAVAYDYGAAFELGCANVRVNTNPRLL